MFFIRSFQAMYEYVNEAIATLTNYVDAEILTVSNAIATAVTNLTNYIDGLISAQATYTDEQIALLRTYIDEQVATSIQLVERGDLAAVDYGVGTFTIDYAYHELDISSKVGVGERYVLLKLEIILTSAHELFEFRTPGNSNDINSFSQPYVKDDNEYTFEGWVLTDAAGKIEYMFSPGTYTKIDLTIRSYLVL